MINLYLSAVHLYKSVAVPVAQFLRFHHSVQGATHVLVKDWIEFVFAFAFAFACGRHIQFAGSSVLSS